MRCDSCKKKISRVRKKHFDGMMTMELDTDLVVGEIGMEITKSQNHYRYVFCGKCSNKLTRLLSDNMGI